MALIVVGDFSSFFQQAVINYIEQHFSKIPTAAQKGVPKLQLSYAPVPDMQHTRHSTFHHPELSKTTLKVWNPLKESEFLAGTPQTNHPDISRQWNYSNAAHNLLRDCALSVIDYTFIKDTEDPSSPIETFNVHMRDWVPYNKRKIMSLSLRVRDGKVAEAYERCLVNLKHLSQFEPRTSHVEATKKISKQDFKNDITAFRQLDHEYFADSYVETFFNSQPLSSHVANWTALAYLCDKVTQNHLKGALKEWDIFSPEGRSVSVFVQSQKEKRGIVPQLEHALTHVKALQLKPTTEMEDSCVWLREELPTCRVQSRQTLQLYNRAYDYGIGIDTVQFENGCKVLLAPTQDQNPGITLRFFLPYGRAHFPLAESLNADIALRACFGLGFKNSFLSDIIPILQQAGLDRAKFSMGLSTTLVEMDLETEEQLELGLRVMYAQLSWFQEISFNQFKAAFDRAVKTRHDWIIEDIETSKGYFYHFLHRRLFGQLSPVLRPDVNDLRLAVPEKGYAMLKQLFGNFSNTTLLICGNFKNENARWLIQKTIGNLKSISPRMANPIPDFKFPENANRVKRGERLPVSDISDLSTTLMYFPVKSWAHGEEQLSYSFASMILSKYLMDKIRFNDQQTYSLLGDITESDLEHGDNLLTLLFYSKTDAHSQLKDQILKAVEALSKESAVVIDDYMKFQREKMTKERNDQKRLTSFWSGILEAYIIQNKDLSLIPQTPVFVDTIPTERVRAILAETCNLKGKPFVEVTMHPE